MKQRTFSCSGIVLKHSKTAESDRILTLLTKERGKVVLVAKGVRKLHSSKRGILESGNWVTAFCVATKSLPLLTQAKLVEDCSSMQPTLRNFRALSQLLEIFAALFVEEELEEELFELIITLRAQIITNDSSPTRIRALLSQLIVLLGYQDLEASPHSSISEYVASLIDKPLRSFEYLSLER